MALYIWAGIILAVLGFIFWIYREAKSSGKAAIAADVAEETADTLRKQDRAAAEAASEDAVDRLRKGGF